MSICWKCGKEFVNENNLGTILCYDCASKIPMTTASSQIYNFDIKNYEINKERKPVENNTKYCPKCGAVMYVDTNKHRTDPSCYEVFCPQCGETEIVKDEIITMADLGNHIECPFCNKKDQRIVELERELKKEQEKHCDACYCDLQRENEKLKAELESKKQMLAGKRFEMFDNDIKQTSTLNGVEFTYEQMLVIKQYEGFCDNKEKQTAVKEFADKIKDINFVDYCEIRNYDQIKYVWFNYVSFNVKINKLLKEKGIE